MKATRETVERWANERGLEPVQIDGIPEGFSFREQTLTIGTETHPGDYIAYIPLSDFVGVYAKTVEELLEIYNQKNVKRNK